MVRSRVGQRRAMTTVAAKEAVITSAMALPAISAGLVAKPAMTRTPRKPTPLAIITCRSTRSRIRRWAMPAATNGNVA